MEAREIGDELMATVCLRFSAKSDAARDGSPIVQSGPRWASVSRSRAGGRRRLSQGVMGTDIKLVALSAEFGNER